MTHSIIVHTTYGQVLGNTSENGVHSFLGIPYAIPPEQTPFEAPKPPIPFKKLYDARAYGPTAPQSPRTAPLSTIFPEKYIPGANYLT